MNRKPTEDDGLSVLRQYRRPLFLLGLAIAVVWIGMALIGALRLL